MSSTSQRPVRGRRPRTRRAARRPPRQRTNPPRSRPPPAPARLPVVRPAPRHPRHRHRRLGRRRRPGRRRVPRRRRHPAVAAFAPEPLGLALGVPTDTAKTLIADALDLVHRLPHTWRRAPNPGRPVWRARRLAQKTHTLTVKAAAHVDRVLAPRLHTVGVTLLDRTVAHAIAKYMPEEHATREERSRQTWDVTLHHPNPDRVRRHQRAPRHRRHDHPHPPLRPDLRHRRRPQDRTATTTRSASARPKPSATSPAPRRPSSTCTSTADPADTRRPAGPRSSAPPPPPRSATGSATPGPPSNPSSAPTGPTRSTPTTHPPGCATWSSSATPPASSPTANATPGPATSTTSIPYDDTGPPGQTRPSQPRPAVQTTPPRQDQRPLAIPTTTRRHLRVDRPGILPRPRRLRSSAAA